MPTTFANPSPPNVKRKVKLYPIRISKAKFRIIAKTNKTYEYLNIKFCCLKSLHTIFFSNYTPFFLKYPRMKAT